MPGSTDPSTPSKVELTCVVRPDSCVVLCVINVPCDTCCGFEGFLFKLVSVELERRKRLSACDKLVTNGRKKEQRLYVVDLTNIWSASCTYLPLTSVQRGKLKNLVQHGVQHKARSSLLQSNETRRAANQGLHATSSQNQKCFSRTQERFHCTRLVAVNAGETDTFVFPWSVDKIFSICVSNSPQVCLVLNSVPDVQVVFNTCISKITVVQARIFYGNFIKRCLFISWLL